MSKQTVPTWPQNVACVMLACLILFVCVGVWKLRRASPNWNEQTVEFEDIRAPKTPAEFAAPAIEHVHKLVESKRALTAAAEAEVRVKQVFHMDVARRDAQRDVVSELEKKLQREIEQALDGTDDVLAEFAPAFETRARLAVESAVLDQLAAVVKRSSKEYQKANVVKQNAHWRVLCEEERIHSAVVANLLMEKTDSSKPTSAAVALVVAEIDDAFSGSVEVGTAVDAYHHWNDRFLVCLSDFWSAEAAYNLVKEVPDQLSSNKEEFEKLLAQPLASNLKDRLERARIDADDDALQAAKHQAAFERYTAACKHLDSAKQNRARAFDAVLMACARFSGDTTWVAFPD